MLARLILEMMICPRKICNPSRTMTDIHSPCWRVPPVNVPPIVFSWCNSFIVPLSDELYVDVLILQTWGKTDWGREPHSILWFGVNVPPVVVTWCNDIIVSLMMRCLPMYWFWTVGKADWGREPHSILCFGVNLGKAWIFNHLEERWEVKLGPLLRKAGR